MSERDPDFACQPPRRDFMKQAAVASAALGTAATALFGGVDPRSGALGINAASAADSPALKMAFIQWQPHTVPAAWSKGIEEVLKEQPSIQYKLLVCLTESPGTVRTHGELMRCLWRSAHGPSPADGHYPWHRHKAGEETQCPS